MSNNIVQRLMTKNFDNLMKTTEEEVYEIFNVENQRKIDYGDSDMISLYLRMVEFLKPESRTICCHANFPEFRIPEK